MCIGDMGHLFESFVWNTDVNNYSYSGTDTLKIAV